MYSKIFTLLQILVLLALLERISAAGNDSEPIGKKDCLISKLVGDWYTDRYLCTSPDFFNPADPYVCTHIKFSVHSSKLIRNITLITQSGKTVQMNGVLKQKSPGVFKDQEAHLKVTVVEADYTNYITVVMKFKTGYSVCIDRRSIAEPLPQADVDKIYKTLQSTNIDTSKFILMDKTKTC